MKGSPLKIIVIITLIVVALIVVLVVLNNNSSQSKLGTTFEDQPSIEGQPTLGDADAPVTVVEFGDFKCPSCKAWGETIYPQLVSDYVDTGKVKFSFINVLFHGEESKLGSLAAESVYNQNPEAYWDFHKELFNEQPSENHDSKWITTEKILEVAKSVSNIDTEKLKSDIETNAAMNEINKDTELVNKFEVKLTPTIMINDIMIEDPFDYEVIKQVIDKELEDN
ncbi:MULTISPECIES: DsbA family protein [Oceanobacillus]|uniref:DsbA family protein n=2 Tax=Oceanobacillus TaxID=182709 RepID=A0ABW5Q114_9BACI|nr:DsbA family protein [Oceanobacillus jordanicus]MCG3419711.1 DsbA family protein [Oceanobacillus jordanicus]